MKSVHASIVMVFVFLGSACQQPQTGSTVSVTRFTQEGEGSVNSWIIEDGSNVVVIDAQRSLSAGRELSEALRATGKPLRAVLLSHPHPDHFGGLGALVEAFPNVPILSSAETQRIMRNDENGFIRLTRLALGDDAPADQPIPTDTFDDGNVLSWGEINLIVDERGIGGADSMTIFLEPAERFLFVGDVVDNGMTPFLMEGQTTEWLTQLKGMRADYVSPDLVVFPGHGPRGDTSLFEEGEEFLVWVRTAVSASLDNGFSEGEIDEIVDRYDALYPNRPAVAAIPELMRENARAVARELEGLQAD